MPRSTALRRSRLVAAITRMFAFDEPRPAEPLELALLQHAQELRLRREAHLADLVEEQHAAGRQLDLARLGLLRARERAALVAEQLRLEQLLRQRGAVQRDERSLASARDARWMNLATTSFPVPDSPVTSTVVSVLATCAALFSTSSHSADSPTTRLSFVLKPDPADGIRVWLSAGSLRGRSYTVVDTVLARRS